MSLRFKFTLIGLLLTVLIVGEAESARILEDADYRIMLENLEKSPDVKLPCRERMFADGYTPTYLFVCAACGRSTRYWGSGILTYEHVGRARRLVSEIQSLGCAAKLDDTRLCQHCHPERFCTERRPVSAVLLRGVQEIPLCSGGLRYVPESLPVEITGWSDDGGLHYSLKTDKPYSILDRSLVDADGLITKDVYVSSFVSILSDPEKGMTVRLDSTQGGGSGLWGVNRSISRGERVVVKDLLPPDGDGFADTNAYSRFCLVTTPGKKMKTSWSCSAKAKDVGEFHYENGVVAPFAPLFLSINGGARRRVTVYDLKVLLSFLKNDPVVYYGLDCCATKSKVKRLEELLLSTDESLAQSQKELAELCVTRARREKNAADAFKRAFLLSAQSGLVAHMDWNAISNRVANAVEKDDRQANEYLLKVMLEKVNLMRKAGDVLRSYGIGYVFAKGNLSGWRVRECTAEGLVMEGGFFSRKRVVSWVALFNESRDCVQELFSHCLRKEMRLFVRCRARIGFAMLQKYMAPNPQASIDLYANYVQQICEGTRNEYVHENMYTYFPEVFLTERWKGARMRLSQAHLSALLDDTNTVDMPMCPYPH